MHARPRIALPSITLLLTLTIASNADTLRVDDDAPPAGDGLSWPTAFNSLQDAIAAASPNDTLLVAGGTYRPDQGADLTPGDQSLSFNFTNLTILGAHAGIGAPDPDARDPMLYPSTLSGDLADNDGPDFQNTIDNTHTIFSGFGFTLDAFTITGAANGPTGAIIQDGSFITGCHFHHNSAANGGALTADSGEDSEVRNCIFEHNRAIWDGIEDSGTGFGGAVYLENYDTTFFGCRFSHNHAANGGAIGAWFDARRPGGRFFNCILTANVADHPDTFSCGGAIFYVSQSSYSISLYHCLIYANHAPNGIGGGVYAANQPAALVSSILWANQDMSGRSFEAQTTRFPRGPTARPPHNIIEDAPLGQPWALPDEPLFVDPLGPDGVLGTADDNFVPAAGSPAIEAAIQWGIVPPLDFRGLTRIVDDPATPNDPYEERLVDLGPFEYQEDCDNSGVFDSVELALNPGDDNFLEDCDANGVPDICQTFHDCNDNQLHDECEIAEGSVQDCNANGIPDACDIALGTSTDHNTNDIPDDCEPAVIHVDASNSRHAPGLPRTGSSWGAAYTNLKDALDAARARAAPTEIWVATGTYHPAPPGGPIRIGFDIPPALTLLGGFDGSETDALQRDPDTNTTILSGDLLDNDLAPRTGQEPDPFQDNTFTLLRIGRGEPPTIDGFTITGAYARITPAPGTVVFTVHSGPDPPDFSVPRQLNDSGAALRLAAGTATFRHCRFAHNRIDAGSIIDLSRAARLTLEDCIIDHNTPLLPGSDIFGNDDFGTPFRTFAEIEPEPHALPSLVIRRSTIKENAADEGASEGSADVIDVGLTDVKLDRVLITANRQFEALIDTYIGELHDEPFRGMASSLIMLDSAIVANDGTAIRIIDERLDAAEPRDEIVMINSTVAHNDAGIDLDIAFPDFHNSIVFANIDFQILSTGPLLFSGLSTIHHNTIQDFDPADNNGANVVANIADNPLFADTLGPDATPRTGDEDFSLLPGSTSIDSGDASNIPNILTKDLAGLPRLTNDATPDTGVPGPLGLHIDRGAYETQPQRSPADINGDNHTDVLDFAILATAFGTTPNQPNHDPRADLNKDHAIDILDFAVFAREWSN